MKGTVKSHLIGIFSIYAVLMLSGSSFSVKHHLSATSFQYPLSVSTQPTLTALLGHLQERPAGVAKQR